MHCKLQRRNYCHVPLSAEGREGRDGPRYGKEENQKPGAVVASLSRKQGTTVCCSWHPFAQRTESWTFWKCIKPGIREFHVSPGRQSGTPWNRRQRGNETWAGMGRDVRHCCSSDGGGGPCSLGCSRPPALGRAGTQTPPASGGAWPCPQLALSPRGLCRPALTFRTVKVKCLGLFGHYMCGN